MTALLPALYAVFVVLCAVHGAHRLVLLLAWLRVRGRAPSEPPLSEAPYVTVQLPVYNERDVVERLVDAVAAMDWPADRLAVQLLDDSTDDTGVCAAAALARARARGLAVDVIRRADRSGFKAGALAAGLAAGRGELFAVFDADFVPPRDFLRRAVPHFADPGVGMVQAAWGHLNAGASLLTRAQATLLDGHFVIEHTARARGGRWFNFNGTAGVWRRAAVEAAGGWQADTLTEDLDLSYRAQLAGWRFVYLLEHVVPAELPEALSAFRSQQRRWAKGSVEVARKLLPRVLRADAPLATRLEAVAHLCANLAWPAALGIALVLPPLVVVRGADPGGAWFFAPVFALSVGAHVAFYAAATRGRLVDVALATVLGIGLAVNQTAAVLEALRGRRSAFVRTPKGGAGGSYRVDAFGAVPFELALAALHLGAAGWAVAAGAWGAVPFLLLFGGGFSWTGLAGLRELLGRAPAFRPPALDAPVGGK